MLPTTEQTSNLEKRSRELYLSLLKRCLIGFTFEDSSVAEFPREGLPPTIGADDLADIFAVRHFNPAARSTGADWPSQALSMIGLARMNNLQCCVQDVLENGVPGDLIETGVWRGGAVIFMKGILSAYAAHDRRVWVADSFDGLPPPRPEDYPHDENLDFSGTRFLAVSLEEVKRNFERYELLDDSVCFLKGFFRDTLHQAPIRQLSVLRLDGDLYESTILALDALYPKVSSGGYVIVDDFGLPACYHAVSDYRAKHDISDEIVDIDGTGAFWKKT